jgi:16S rRNA C967 or C1407 C5-methylase (RsmB/RsmF family)
MNLPADFIYSVRAQLGGETEPFLAALAQDAPVSIRLNPFKRQRNPLTFLHPAERVPWSGQGYYLDERPSFTFDPLFHAGCYYVQEASSMFIEHVVRKLVSEPVTCLDLCAAPGGKSVGLLSALPAGSLLVSNEVVRQRATVLSETLIKFGHPNTVVTQNSAKDFAAFPGLFDLILVDAPCSGEGMFRKDEVAVQEWSPQNVKMCAARQKDILSDVWPALKPGGLLVYSTCTYNSEENEENARWTANQLGALFTRVAVDADWNITPSRDGAAGGYHFYPHKIKGEGLFVTVLQKQDA